MEPGTLLSDRYEIVALLGEGAMGAVYKGRHTLLNKDVAIKVLHRAALEHPGALERFRQEAQAAAHIDHPNVCAATDFGETPDGAFFLVMEYLEGVDLETLLEQEKRLPPERAVQVAEQICAALERTHALGIVHRDLKPANIMLIQPPGMPFQVKILDFGIARSFQDDEEGDAARLTRAGTTVGTPAYMAPEQSASSSVDGRADLYALGVMLYEMLAGRRPFESDERRAAST